MNKQKFQFPWNYVKWNADNLIYSHFTISNLSVLVFVEQTATKYDGSVF